MKLRKQGGRMTELVRFEDWVFDRNEIKVIEIVIDPTDLRNIEIEKKRHNVIIHFKANGAYNKITYIAYNKHKAENQLDRLTANLKAEDIGGPWDHYLLNRIERLTSSFSFLGEDVRKLMRSYSAKKKKLENKD